MKRSATVPAGQVFFYPDYEERRPVWQDAERVHAFSEPKIFIALEPPSEGFMDGDIFIEGVVNAYSEGYSEGYV
jgi:hypothetical protein